MNHTDQSLASLRNQLDHCDQKILCLLSKRMEIVEKVGQYKSKHHLQPLDRARWQQVLCSRTKIGTKFGLDSDFVLKIFATIHQYSLRAQEGVKI